MVPIVPRFRDTKLYDLLAVAPLTAWYSAGIAGMAPQIASLAQRYWHGQDLNAGLSAAAKFALLLFLGLQILLFVIRRVPIARREGVLPPLAAIAGSNLQLAFLALPQVRLSPGWSLTATLLILIGTAGAFVSLAWLGRAFAIFPQARGLVTGGPYRLVRHPLYLTEQIATFGAMLQFEMPWALFLALVSFAAQFPRMHYEEHVLETAFPEYRDYAARTRRLIPCLY